MTRRRFLTAAAGGAASLGAWSVLGAPRAWGRPAGPAGRVVDLARGWRFGALTDDAALLPGFDDGGFEPVTLPHVAAELSWHDWDPDSWQQVWVYRRSFDLPARMRRMRVFAELDGAQATATPWINGTALDEHDGGYTPARWELTDHVRDAGNVLAVRLDSRWLQVPPAGNPAGPTSIDFWQPGGLHRGARLVAVPQVHIADAIARARDVLDPARRALDVEVVLDAAVATGRDARVEARLRRIGPRGARGAVVASGSGSAALEAPGRTSTTLTLERLARVDLWDVEHPVLYALELTLHVAGQPLHAYTTRIGFREARFEEDGFQLNGRRLQVVGLNRHELHPFRGMAMPGRVQRRDAEILRRELNCNLVRTSHYPQSPHFLDACDELGLLVWDEIPGWHYVGDDAWQQRALADVDAMIRRDRNRPSVVLWGIRINESPDQPELYARTQALARELDPTRATCGAMNIRPATIPQDVYTFNDYRNVGGKPSLQPPVPGKPYLVSEAVGQFPAFRTLYTRVAAPAIQQQQAELHARAHDQARNPGYLGLIGWECFDQASGAGNRYMGTKTAGVMDTFREPKLGAAFYRSQIDPAERVVIEPSFHWDFGPRTPRGPGAGAWIGSNCERLEVYVGGEHRATALPDRATFPNLPWPLFAVDLDIDTAEAATLPELRLDGYVGDRLAGTRSFASDPAGDRFLVTADDRTLRADGVDATRVAFRVADRYGAQRPYDDALVGIAVDGPGEVLGDNPFDTGPTGGVGAVWIRTREGRPGRIAVTVTHPRLGAGTVTIAARGRP